MSDAAPLAIYRYTLTWQDALAYERLPKTMPGLQQATLYLWLAIAGVLLVALPPDAVGEVNTPRFWLSGAGLVVIQYAIFRLARAITRLNRARYRLPTPVEVELVQWPERLEVRRDGKFLAVPFEEIAALLPTAKHLFIAIGGDLIIAPVGAFGDAVGMQKLVDAIDSYMRARRGTPGEVDLDAANA